MDELGKLASAVNAPGNDVFDSHNVDAESAAMTTALRVFNEHISQIEEKLPRPLSYLVVRNTFAIKAN